MAQSRARIGSAVVKHPPIGLIAIRIVLPCVVLAGLAWVGMKLDWPLIGSQLRAASLSAEIGMAVASLAALFIRPFRLLILLRELTPQTSQRYWRIWSADLVAMAINSVVPMRAGDMTMAFGLRQGQGDRTARVFSVVVIDRLFDFATVIVLFVFALSWAPTVAAWASHLRIMLLVLLIAIVVSLWFVIRMQQTLLLWLERLLSGFTPQRGEQWYALGRDLFAGLAIVQRPGIFIPVLLLSLSAWAVTGGAYWFGIEAVWPSVPFAAGAFVAGAIALSFVVPVTPGGIGVFQAVAVLALSLFDVPAEPALAFAIILHAFQLSSVLILACVGLLSQGISIRSLVTFRDTRQ